MIPIRNCRRAAADFDQPHRTNLRATPWDALAFLLILLVVCLVYAAPTLVAFRRGHPNRYLIGAINLVGGMTGFLWVATLIWALRAVHISAAGDNGGESGLNPVVNDPLRATVTRDKPAQLAQLQDLLAAGHVSPEEHARLRAEFCALNELPIAFEGGLLMTDYLDRACGALFGLAVGDALGAPLEFADRDEEPIVTEMIGGGPFNLEPGAWTDDTAMALCLADSLIAHQGVDTHDLMRRFVRWWRAGENSVTGDCFDIGMTTARALRRFETTGDILVDPDPQTAGNGSLMRLAPVAIFAGTDTELAIDLAREQSACTHGAPVCLDACAYFAELLSDALHGADKRSVLSRRPILADIDERLAEIALGSYRIKKREEIRSGGSVLDTLEAALWAIWHAESFEEALIAAVNLANDADTVGAITGQLAGAIWGASAIPARWLEKLAWRGTIEERALELIRQTRPIE